MQGLQPWRGGLFPAAGKLPLVHFCHVVNAFVSKPPFRSRLVHVLGEALGACEAEPAGINAHLAKPMDFGKLAAVLREYLV